MIDWPEHWHFTFLISGIAAPGGSKSAYVVTKKDGTIVRGKGGRPIVNVTDDAGKRNKNWKKTVAWTAKQKWKAKPLSGPCVTEFLFIMPRPQAHFRSGKFRHLLREDAPMFHTQKPDALKLARSTEDALTSVVYADDSQSVRIVAEKRWCAPGEQPGCIVTVRALKTSPVNACQQSSTGTGTGLLFT